MKAGGDVGLSGSPQFKVDLFQGEKNVARVSKLTPLLERMLDAVSSHRVSD